MDKLCLYCSKTLKSKYSTKFCGSSCSASYNNVRKVRKKRKACLVCRKEVKNYGTDRKFCSPKCNGVYASLYSDACIENGDQTSWTIIRNYLIRHVGKCMECGLSKWRGKKLILQCDHIDGNRNNNTFTNARLLCPNCHSQTETFCRKGRYINFGDLPKIRTST